MRSVAGVILELSRDQCGMEPGFCIAEGQGQDKEDSVCEGLLLSEGVLLEEPNSVLQPWKWTSKGMKARGAGWPSAIDREAH